MHHPKSEEGHYSKNELFQPGEKKNCLNNILLWCEGCYKKNSFLFTHSSVECDT